MGAPGVHVCQVSIVPHGGVSMYTCRSSNALRVTCACWGSLLAEQAQNNYYICNVQNSNNVNCPGSGPSTVGVPHACAQSPPHLLITPLLMACAQSPLCTC